MADPNIPAQWRPLFEAANIESYRELARHMKMDHQRLGRAIGGLGTSDETVHAIARFFKIDSAEVWRLRGEAPTRSYVAPEAGRHLSDAQRRAVDLIITTLADANLAASSAEGADESKSLPRGRNLQSDLNLRDAIPDAPATPRTDTSDSA